MVLQFLSFCPNCPKELNPHEKISPSLLIAREKSFPVEIWWINTGNDISIGKTKNGSEAISVIFVKTSSGETLSSSESILNPHWIKYPESKFINVVVFEHIKFVLFFDRKYVYQIQNLLKSS